MPEVNEVRQMSDFIRKKTKNKEILEINILGGRYKKKNKLENLDKIKKELPLKVKDVKNKGKLLYIIFENNIYLLSKLGLVGSWVYKKNDKYQFSDTMEQYSQFGEKKEIDTYVKNTLKHLNIEFITKEGALYYSDMLSYGTLKFVIGKEELNKELEELGPDIMDKNTSLEVFKEHITRKNNLDKKIGNIIVNQKLISGIGNYLRADILYLSKIDPFRKVKTLSDQELENIYNNSRLLTWGVYNKAKAKKMDIVKKDSMLPEKYNRLFFIYMQDEDIYGNKVIKKELYDGSQKRFVYYVKEIQK
jgi:formamidopyrimidine-DNA glycosylase